MKVSDDFASEVLVEPLDVPVSEEEVCAGVVVVAQRFVQEDVSRVCGAH